MAMSAVAGRRAPVMLTSGRFLTPDATSGGSRWCMSGGETRNDGRQHRGGGHGDSAYSADAEGFDSFYRVASPALLKQLYALLGDLDEARDCLQEAFVKAWLRWDRISRYEKPAAWVRHVAWRLAASRWRRAKNAARILLRYGGAPMPTEPTWSDGVAVGQALATLPKSQREAVSLYYFADLSVDEIAKSVGAPEGTVKARLSRARATLRGALSEGVGDD
ncbi:MAG: SigE family RNA polymerase sigma factor [Actinomycetota bacterium]